MEFYIDVQILLEKLFKLIEIDFARAITIDVMEGNHERCSLLRQLIIEIFHEAHFPI